MSRRRIRLVAGLGAGVVLAVAGAVMLSLPTATVGSHTGPEGTIRLAPDQQKLCQSLGFDNRNGEFRDRGVAPCEPQGSGDTPIDRMQAIRAGFNRR